MLCVHSRSDIIGDWCYGIFIVHFDHHCTVEITVSASLATSQLIELADMHERTVQVF